MKRIFARSGPILLLTVLLQACGGGGGGGGDGGGSGSTARVSFSTTNVSASATPGDLAPQRTVILTVTNNPPPTVYYTIDHSAIGLEIVQFVQTGPGQGELRFSFRSPGSLANGTYNDTVEIRVCPDDLCRTDLRGSPATVRTAYVVSGSGTTSAVVNPSIINLTADQREVIGRREDVTVTLNALPPSGIRIQTIQSSNALDFVAWGATGLVTNLDLGFDAGDELALGTYTDSVSVRVCYDDSCVRQIAGSPFTISTTLNVTLGVEPGVAPLQVLSRQPLGHDVIDAEYSAAMNAIVMVGSNPQNAIYVFDIDTGIESERLLSLAPTAVSVSPDGLTAAVGHDAFISVVDLPDVGDAGAPPPIVLNVSIPVNDVALDGNGHVYAVPISEQGDNIHAIDIATNTEQQTPGFVERIRLQPGALALYGLPDLPPNDLEKWNVSSGVPNYLYRWPYDLEHDACDDFWFSEPGDRIHTGCGKMFSASADPAQDLILVGSLALTEPAGRGENYIQSLSHSAVDNEIALLEWHFFDCNLGPLYRPCYTRLAYFDDTTFNRTALYGIGPVTSGGISYAQRGRYVFHDGQSSQKYLIGELEAPPSEDQRYWISVIQ
ncbi:MAG: hypothetical protein AB7P44_08260 [Steroidobacteraceae bacterium]